MCTPKRRLVVARKDIMRRSISIVIAIFVVMLLAAGCGSGGEDISVQQLGGGNTTPGQEEDATVVEDDGTERQVPFVGDGPGVSSPAPASVVTDTPQAPAVVDDEVRQTGVLTDWCDLRERVRQHGMEWYAQQFQVNGHFRFSWEDTETWCQRQRRNNLDARAIVIVGVNNVSDAEARSIAREDGVEHPERLPVLRYTEVINTRGLEEHQLSEFVHGQSMVRVTLLPLVRTAEGLQLDPAEGVFTDCLNRWRVNLFGFNSTPMRPSPHGPTGNPPGTPPGNPHNPPPPPPPPNPTTSTTTPNTTSTTTPNTTSTTTPTATTVPCTGPNCPKDDTVDVNPRNPDNPATGCGAGAGCGGNNGDIPYVPAPPLPVFNPPNPASPPPPGGSDSGGTAPSGSADTPSGPVTGPPGGGTNNPLPGPGSGDDHSGEVPL